MRSHWLLLALIGLLLPLMLLAATPPPAIPGGLKRIPKENIGDPRLKLMAEFAVSMYNLRTHKKLVVERVIRGETQMVEGQNYQLVVLAKDGSLPNSTAGFNHAHYELSVCEQSWKDLWKLNSFRQLYN